MGANHSRPITAALVVACATQLPAETHAFATLMPTKPVVTKSSRHFLYLGNDGESVPIANGVKKNKTKQPDLIIPPSSLGIDEAWAATMELEMEMNMSNAEEDFDDDPEDAQVLNVQNKVESLHRSLLEARLSLEKRAAVDSSTLESLVIDDNDTGSNKSLDSVRVQVEATAQKLDAALADIDQTLGTSIEQESKETNVVDKEIEPAFKQKEMSQVGFSKSIQPADTRIYRAFLSLKEKRLEEALRAAEDYELMAAEALRKAQEEEKIRLARLAVIQKLTVDAVRQAKEERELLAAKKVEALHRSLLETRLEMESRQKSLCNSSDTISTSDLVSRPKTTNDIAVDAPAFISQRRKVEPTFLFRRALLETRLKMKSKAKEIDLKAELLYERSKEDETFATEVATPKREIPNDILGSGRTTGHDSQSRRQYYFADEIPLTVEKGGYYSGGAVDDACTQKQHVRGADKTFSLPSFFGEALDTVGNALDSMDATFAKWIESRSNPKSTISMMSNSVEELHQLSVNKVDRVEEVRTGKQSAAAPRPTFILKGAKSFKRLSSVPRSKDVASESTVHRNGNENSIAAASIKRRNETENSTSPSIEQDERQQSRDRPNGRPTFILRKGKGGPDPEKDEGEPQVQHKSTLTTPTWSVPQHESHANTTSSWINALTPETSIMELKEQEDTAIVGNAVAHLAKSAFNGGRAAFFTFGAVLESVQSEGVVSSAKTASSRVASAVESMSTTVTNTTSFAEGVDDTTHEDESANDDPATQISAAAGSVVDVGSAFVRGINSSPLSNEAYDAVRECAKECVSFLASLTAFGIKQGERALHSFETEEDGNISDPFILEQQIASTDISLSTVNIPDEISKCTVVNGAGKNAEPTMDATEKQSKSIAKKRLEVVNFQNMQREICSSKVDRNAFETRKLFRSIFHA